MPKQIQANETIYIAPGIKGEWKEGNPVAVDERSGETLNPKDINDKIKIYERQVKEWFLNPASTLLEQEQNRFKNSFIVIMICMSYFEGIEQYRTGIRSNSMSRQCFKDSIERLYPEKFKDQDKNLNNLYSKARCGLFHDGMVRGGVIFSSGFNESIEFEDNGNKIKINPKLLLQDIRKDFEKYIDSLKDENNAEFQSTREKFNRMFTVLEEN